MKQKRGRQTNSIFLDVQLFSDTSEVFGSLPGGNPSVPRLLLKRWDVHFFFLSLSLSVLRKFDAKLNGKKMVM